MVRKLFILFIPFLFLSCASSKVAHDVSQIENPKIEIKITDNSVMISCGYYGDNWIFLNGVEIKNAAGEVRTFKMNPRRNITASGGCVEAGVFSAAFSDDVKAFLSVAPVYGRALSDLKTFDFMELNYEK